MLTTGGTADDSRSILARSLRERIVGFGSNVRVCDGDTDERASNGVGFE